MRVVFFHRKPRIGNYSIENLFDYVRSALPPSVEWSVKEMRFHSNGLFKRIYCCIESAFSQQQVNHVTGDIHFIVPFLRKKRTVLTIHDLGSLNHPRPLVRAMLRFFWITWPVKRSARVTTVSQATKLELLKYVPDAREKIKVIHNPIAAGFIRREKAFNKQDVTVLQIGTKYNKNVDRLIKALIGLPCKLEIVGRLNADLLKLLQDSKLSFQVSENLTNDEMIEKYRQADIVAFVSTFEGFGMPIIEANATGRAVVSSNISSMPEIAGNAACLVDPYHVESIREGFKRIINDDTYRMDLIEKGYLNAKRFDAITIAKEYATLYESLVN